MANSAEEHRISNEIQMNKSLPLWSLNNEDITRELVS